MCVVVMTVVAEAVEAGHNVTIMEMEVGSVLGVGLVQDLEIMLEVALEGLVVEGSVAVVDLEEGVGLEEGVEVGLVVEVGSEDLDQTQVETQIKVRNQFI